MTIENIHVNTIFFQYFSSRLRLKPSFLNIGNLYQAVIGSDPFSQSREHVFEEMF